MGGWRFSPLTRTAGPSSLPRRLIRWLKATESIGITAVQTLYGASVNGWQGITARLLGVLSKVSTFQDH
jgi:hypothetical protein